MPSGSMPQRQINLIALAALLAISAGCGESPKGRTGLFPVTGTVTIDGKPLTTGMISFMADNAREAFTSPIDGTGKYKLGASATDAGALPGEYKVLIIATEAPKMSTDPANPSQPKSLIPEKYTKKETSGLTATVKSEPNTINFDLKSS